MEKPSFAAALTGSSSIAGSDLIFPECYHSCFTSHDSSLPFIKHAARRNGKPAIFLSADEQLKLAAPLKHTLICKFSARVPSFDLIRKHVESLRLKGPWRLGLLDNRHAMIKLDLEQDYAFLFTKKLHRIENIMVKFLKWTADFDFRSEPPIAPVWVRFPGLKLHLFHKQFLFSLATIFGKPLKLDLHTFNLSRPSAARVLVEMDITFSYADEIWIGSQDEGYWQEVVIDSKPLYCSNCRMFGHCLENCFIANPQLKSDRLSRGNDFEPKNMHNSVLDGNDIATVEKEFNRQTPVDRNVVDILLPSNSQVLTLPIQNRTPINEIQPSYDLGSAGDFSNQEALISGLPMINPTSKSCQLVPITGTESTVTGFVKPVTLAPDSITVDYPIDGNVCSINQITGSSFPLETDPVTEHLRDYSLPQNSQQSDLISSLQGAQPMEQPVTGMAATVTGSVPLCEKKFPAATGFPTSLENVNFTSNPIGDAATSLPVPVSISDPIYAAGLGFHASNSANAGTITSLDVSASNTAAALDITHNESIYNTIAALDVTHNSVIDSAVPTKLVKQAPVFINPTHNANDFISDQSNSDSDSYETYTGSYREEDMQLNEACREVFEEWQEEWEFQKSKKKQKGIRELKSLFKDKGTIRAALGSRRSLRGHGST